MGFFKRIATIIRAYIHRFLNKVEDPEKILEQAIGEMEENLRRSKVELARTIADEKRLKKQIDLNASQAEQWGAKAVLAVKSGDDDLAREALKRKKSYDALVQEFRTNWQTQSEVTERLKSSLRQLQMKIEEAKRKRNLLITRQQRALLQKKIYETLSTASSADPSSTLNKLEEKISHLEAESAAMETLEKDSLEEKFKSLEVKNDIENELSDLKLKYLPDKKK